MDMGTDESYATIHNDKSNFNPKREVSPFNDNKHNNFEIENRDRFSSYEANNSNDLKLTNIDNSNGTKNIQSKRFDVSDQENKDDLVNNQNTNQLDFFSSMIGRPNENQIKEINASLIISNISSNFHIDSSNHDASHLNVNHEVTPNYEGYQSMMQSVFITKDNKVDVSVPNR